VKPNPELPILVFASQSDDFSNKSAKALAEKLLEALEADSNILVKRVDPAHHTGPVPDTAIALNLSRFSVAEIEARLPLKVRVLELMIVDGESTSATIQDIEQRPSYSIASAAVAMHPSVLSLEIILRHSSVVRSFGSWTGRSHIKSRKRVMATLLAGCYLPLELLFQHLASGGQLSDYSLARVISPVIEPPSKAATAFLNLCHFPRWCLRSIASIPERSTWLQWNIGAANITDGDNPQEFDIKWVSHRKGGFFADPFLLSFAGYQVVLFEEIESRTGKGYISAAPISPVGEIDLDRKQVVLTRPFHLSFPFVLVHENVAYMVPEQAEAGHLSMYCAKASPFEWTECAILKQGHLADPVLFPHNGHWYLFASAADRGNHDNNLQLFISDEATGPYRLHPASPLKLSLAGSRMAAGIRCIDQRLLRYGQDCSRIYGERVIEFEIERLTPAEYHEREVKVLALPSRDSHRHAFHTFNVSGTLAVVDGGRKSRSKH